MFKSKEELIREYLEATEDDDIYRGYAIGVNSAFSSIAERKEFYKRYRVSTDCIKKNHKLGGVYNIELWYDYPELVERYLNEDEMDYNDWLFDFCFDGVK